MTDEQQLRVQAFLDQELPDKDSREMAAWLAQDAEGQALARELRNTGGALKGFEQGLKVPASREFYWSKIKREIERPAPVAVPAPSVSFLTLLRRALLPLGAVAMLALAGIVTVHQFGGAPGVRPVQVNAILADAGAFTYRDEAQGMTVVWLSYPAEKKLADSASPDTLPAK
jgi:anti-sigma factor RsiW